VSRLWTNASIRVRLTAWHMAVLALMLVAHATATFLAVRHEFREQLEQESHEHVEAASPEFQTALEERLQQQLREILVVLVLGLPLIVALAGFGGYLLARRALSPIDHLAGEARRITAERLHERSKRSTASRAWSIPC
jgi:hypothetical protein